MENDLKQRILDATEGGLQILKDLYPGIEQMDQHGKFKIRDEKTPSAHLKEKDGIWTVKDYGGDQIRRNAIDCWMEENHYEQARFGEACKALAAEYGVVDVLTKELNKSRCVERDAKPDEEEGKMYWSIRDFTDQELKLLGPMVTADTCQRLGYYCLEWYGTVKDRKVKEWHSDPDLYPIFMRECMIENAKNGQPDRFYKIYRPKEVEKQWRFQYYPKDTMPQDYMHGFVEMKKIHKQLNEEMAMDDEKWQTKKISDIPKPGSDRGLTRYHRVVLCSGERDALCVAARGDIPLWANSETKVMSLKQYLSIVRYAGDLYNIPDLDTTGIRQGTLKALAFPDIKTVWLPTWLLEKRDNRGRPCKDFRDWCGWRSMQTDYQDLMDRAAPAKFWITETSEKTGKAKTSIDSTALHMFLRLHGFYRLKDDDIEEPQYVRLVDHVVVRKKPRDIRDFVRLWTQDEQDPDRPGERLRGTSNIPVTNSVRNAVLTDAKLSAVYLSALPEVNPDFTVSSSTMQRYFFLDGVATVTRDGIDFKRWKELQLETYCWKQQVISRRFRKLEPMFQIRRILDVDGHPASYNDGQPVYDIDISDAKSSHFFSYLINASRLYWRKEMEMPYADAEQRRTYRELHPFDIAGEHLTIQEIREQKRCLINKIFTIGYMLHSYKAQSRSWAPYAMDNRISEDSQANGRSGKSFFFKAFELMQMQMVKLSGRNDHLTDNPHLYDQVTRFTQIVQIDDLSKRIQANSFYDLITGDMTVNPKNNKSYTIPFDESPKFAFTTNYVPSDFDPSSDARLLYMVFGDYYHQRTSDGDSDYLETRSIRDDFGKDLFGSNYSEDEYNADQNFLLQCLHFYLTMTDAPVKLLPPMDNIVQRNLLSRMSVDDFKGWAESFFSPDGGNVNRKVPREECLNSFIRMARPQGKWSAKRFTQTLHAFARWAPWIAEIDPKELCDSQGRIFDNDTWVTTENNKQVHPMCYYLRTDPDWHPDDYEGQAPISSSDASAGSKDHDLRQAEIWHQQHGDEAF